MLQGDKRAWERFRAGWKQATSARLGVAERNAAAAAFAAVHLLSWREISRYMSYDGTPGTGFVWASPADPVRYERTVREAKDMLDVGG